jgi:hypothetical protein
MGHGAQARAAGALAKAPAGQLAQLDLPFAGWLVPDAQFVHTAAAAAEYKPAAHGRHLFVGTAVEYWPGEQYRHLARV